MISLVLAMIWSRRGQAVTLALLASFAVAAAVASPAYLLAVDRAIAVGQIGTADAAERGLVVAGVQNDRDSDSSQIDFKDFGASLVKLPGFTYIYAAEFPVIGIEPGPQYADRFVFRQDVCSHVRMISGRCPAAEGEVIIGVATAKRLRLVAGQSITMRAAKYSDDPKDPGYIADGRAKKLVIAGTYRANAPEAPYWGTHGYFTGVPGLGPGEPIFTNPGTLDAMDHGDTAKAIDGSAGPRALDPDHLDELRAGLAALNSDPSELGAAIQISTGIPALLDRIDAGRSAAHLLVPVLAVPLVLLACFSIFLAVGYGTEGRQPELAVVALRGSRWWTRWWLAIGENIAAVAVGAVAGCVAGQLLVNAVASARFPGVGVDQGLDSLRYAPYAALAALVAAVLAQRRQLLSPVASLLRRNAVPADGRRAVATEAVIVLLAVVTTAQLVISDGALTGVGLMAPAFLMLAVAVLGARLLLPAVTRYAGRALDRGHLGVALAAFQLSRRPGAQRLFALLVATVAVAGYAACTVDVADGGRRVQSRLGIGADRVLKVDGSVFRSQLLTAVRNVDPDGRYAMAVVRMPNIGHSEPPGLAVDSTRLAAVANWPSGGPSAAELASRLRPEAPAPLVLTGPQLAIEATGSGFDPEKELRLAVAVSSTTGAGDALVQLGKIHNGRFRYQQRVSVCEKGCRLNGVEIVQATAVSSVTGQFVVNSLGAADPTGPLADPAHWRMTRYGTVTADPAGLRITLNAPTGLIGGVWINPVDAPYPLPAAYAGAAPIADSITGAGGGPLPIKPVGRLSAVPRLGRHATLVDLEWADRLATDAGQSLEPQVWLGPAAPADVVGRLSAQGLSIVADTRADQIERQLDRQGPALSLWFYVLAGALSVLLGAGALVLAAAVDRARRVEDLSALRGQGLSRGRLAWATSWTYPILVATAAVVGLVTALAAWLATGWALPLAGLDPPDLPVPTWPRVLVVIGTTVAVFLVLVLVATATGQDLRRRVTKQERARR
ncbi:FtsX-like permease family protein [Paractinoplanes globisporus]|uniref:FtsX-like permease family protein n=1 Tax=Paractinoplanes globisporus TaxID=113565 RepID=A0ABW6WUX0_9ACTN|nr:FtsX-like permease family protein [Actinoplanes globisporus]